jgi:hypothetical protein
MMQFETRQNVKEAFPVSKATGSVYAALMTAPTVKSILFRREATTFTVITRRRLDTLLPAPVQSGKKFITSTGYEPLTEY